MTAVGPESWHEGETSRPPFGQMNAYRVAANVDVFLGVDHEGRRHLLLGLPKGAEGLVDDRSRGLTVVTRNLEVESQPDRSFVDVRCGDPSGYDAFNVVATAILEELERGSSTTNAVAGVLARWRRFWGAVPSTGLTRDEVRGLFGELWFLLVWLLPRGRGQVVHWIGPTGARHDFQWRGLAVEAKATTSVRGHVHRISGLDQLDPPDQGSLYFFSLRIREEPAAANSLVSLVEGITKLLAGDAALLDLFEARLAQAGYSPAHAARYAPTLFRIADERLYRVGEGFPRIGAASFAAGVPRGVESIEYEVNLEACPELVVGRDPSQTGISLPE